MSEKGCTHIYHGDGKGKTTCGMGLCCRAAGAGKRVLIYQFMKDGNGNERRVLEQFPNVSFANAARKVCFSFEMSETRRNEEKRYYADEFARVKDRVRDEGVDVLFLDEILYAVSSGLFDETELIHYLDEKPEGLEVILTGRDPSAEVKSRADYISEIRKEKHPFDRGLTARDGIER